MKLIQSILLASFLALPIVGFSVETININTADKETLMTFIKGVGEKKAEAIIKYREEHGSFESVDELTKVKGIGEEIIQKNHEILTISK